MQAKLAAFAEEMTRRRRQGGSNGKQESAAAPLPPHRRSILRTGAAGAAAAAAPRVAHTVAKKRVKKKQQRSARLDDTQRCSACNQQRAAADFSKRQLRMSTHNRRCTACIATVDAGGAKGSGPAGGGCEPGAAACGWPPSLRAYVEQSFAQCDLESQKHSVETALKATIVRANATNSLWNIDWDSHPLPDPAAHQRKLPKDGSAVIGRLRAGVDNENLLVGNCSQKDIQGVLPDASVYMSLGLLPDVSRCVNATAEGFATICEPHGAAVDAVLSAMKAHPANFEVQHQGLEALDSLLCPPDGYTIVEADRTRFQTNWEVAVRSNAAAIVEAACVCVVTEDPTDSTGRRTGAKYDNSKKVSVDACRCHLYETPGLYGLLTPQIKEQLLAKCTAISGKDGTPWLYSSRENPWTRLQGQSGQQVGEAAAAISNGNALERRGDRLWHDENCLWHTMISRLRANDPTLVSLDLFAIDAFAWFNWNIGEMNSLEAWLELSDALSCNTNLLEIRWDDPGDDCLPNKAKEDIRCGLMDQVAGMAFVNAMRACSVLSVASDLQSPGIVLEQVGASIEPWVVSRALAALTANNPRLKEIRIGDIWSDRFLDPDVEKLCAALNGNSHLQTVDGSDVGYQHELSEAGLRRLGATLADTGVVWVLLPDMDNHDQNHNGAYPRHISPPCFANAIRRLAANDPDLQELSLSILHFDMTEPSLENRWLQPLKTALAGNTVLQKLYIPAAACLSEDGLKSLLAALGASTVEQCEVQLLRTDMQRRVDELTSQHVRTRPPRSAACWPAVGHSAYSARDMVTSHPLIDRLAPEAYSTDDSDAEESFMVPNDDYSDDSDSSYGNHYSMLSMDDSSDQSDDSDSDGRTTTLCTNQHATCDTDDMQLGAYQDNKIRCAACGTAAKCNDHMSLIMWFSTEGNPPQAFWGHSGPRSGASGRYKYKESKDRRWIRDNYMRENAACARCNEELVIKLNARASAAGATIVSAEEADAAYIAWLEGR